MGTMYRAPTEKPRKERTGFKTCLAWRIGCATRKVLFIAEGDHGVNAHGALHGQIARCERDNGQESGHTKVGGKIHGLHADQQTLHELSGTHRGKPANDDANPDANGGLSRTIPKICTRPAPKAMRIPISLVRWPTM